MERVCERGWSGRERVLGRGCPRPAGVAALRSRPEGARGAARGPWVRGKQQVMSSEAMTLGGGHGVPALGWRRV